MSGSIAEERIRAKVEADMRRRYPDARIIHELVLSQGGVRIDLAVVTPDQLIVAEVKSERDTLKRLAEQATVAVEVAQQVWIVLAEKHVEPVLQRRERWIFPVRPGPAVDNPDHIAALDQCWIYRETDGGLDVVDRYAGRMQPTRANPLAMLHMLWADELRTIAQGGKGLSRLPAMDLCVEHLGGRQIRRAVSAPLRRRAFPRADAPVETSGECAA